MAVKDINPQAPAHVLIIPKKHVGSLMDLAEEDQGLVGKLFMAIQKVAAKLGLEDKGFRLIISQGENGGQVVPHLHMHLIGGKKLGAKICHD